MRVCVLTTSYPRNPGDVAGSFVAGTVEHLRAAGHEVTVVSPSSFNHYGIAYGAGIVQNLRAKPWLALLVPLFLANFARAARTAAADADVVHAHWLPSGIAARATGKPFVLQVWGTDVALAAKLGPLVRPMLRRAKTVVAGSEFLADGARALGARDVRIVASGIDVPAAPGEPELPPHVLYAGRLSPEKGITEFVEATEGLNRVIVGDGPLRGNAPETVGFVAPADIGAYYERAAVVAVPSRREGYGVVAREAMAWGRPVVATAVGGLPDAVEDGVTGVLVPVGDVPALRAAIERLLDDESERQRLGAAARETAIARFAWDAHVAALVEIYARAAS